MAKDETKVVVREASMVPPNTSGFQSNEAAMVAEDDDEPVMPQAAVRSAEIPMTASVQTPRAGDPNKLVTVRVFKSIPRMIVGGSMYSFESGKTVSCPRHVRDLLREKGYC